MTADDMPAAWRGPVPPSDPSVAADEQAACRLAQLYALGIDSRDEALVRSVFAGDAVLEGALGAAPADEYVPKLLAGVASYAATMHNITNQYVAIDGDEGVVWSYGHCLHIEPPGTGRDDLHLGVQYRDRVRRADGGWVIVARKTVPMWQRGPLPGGS